MIPGRELNIIVARHVMGHEVVSDEVFCDMERLVDEDGNSVWDEQKPYSEDALLIDTTAMDMNAQVNFVIDHIRLRGGIASESKRSAKETGNRGSAS